MKGIVHVLTVFIANAPLALGGAIIKVALERRATPPRTATGAGLVKRAGTTVNVPLVDYINRTDCQWYSTIQVGTPPQNFTVLWDTGSNDLLIPRSNCSTCGNHTKYDSSKSSTFSRRPGQSITLSFGTGGDSVPLNVPEPVRGNIVTDSVSLGSNLTSPGQTFLACDVYGATLNYQPMDGIIGLGLPNASGIASRTRNPSYLPFYWSLYYRGLLGSPLFSWYIQPGSETGAELTLGGMDETKFQGPLQWIDLDKKIAASAGTWIIDQPAIYINGTKHFLPSQRTRSPDIAVLDTGTAFIQAPDYQTTKDLYAAISPAFKVIDSAGAWGAPCEDMDRLAVDITFTFGPSGGPQGNLTVPKKFFNLGPYPGIEGACQGLFNHPMEAMSYTPTGQKLWVIGSPLLKAYYTVWDGVQQRVGWATPRHGGGALPAC